MVKDGQSVTDAEGLVTSQNLTNGAWISAGETIFFQGQMWFAKRRYSIKFSF